MLKPVGELVVLLAAGSSWSLSKPLVFLNFGFIADQEDLLCCFLFSYVKVTSLFFFLSFIDIKLIFKVVIILLYSKVRSLWC